MFRIPKKPSFSRLPPAASVISPKKLQDTVAADLIGPDANEVPVPPQTLLCLPRINEAGVAEGYHFWTAEDSFEGVQIFGETGAGKSSGSGATIIHSLLSPPESYVGNRFGGLVLTAKTTDVYDWVHPTKGFLAKAGINPRDPERVIVLGEKLTEDLKPPEDDSPREIDTTKSFNFLDYEFSKTGGAIFNLVQLFITALETGSQGNTGQEDAYWLDALRQLLTNAISLVIYATGRLTLLDIIAVIQTAPTTPEQARSVRWQTKQSTCWAYLELAQERLSKETRAAKTAAEREAAGARRRSFKQVVLFWLLDFACLADRTRSVIVSTFTSKVTGLTRDPLFELLCKGEVGSPTFVDIVKATREGKIVIINLPVKRYTEVGRFSQVLCKTVWQRGIERYPDPSHPVFLWADEAQFFTSREDMLFQTTARSSGCATIYLTQNICNYYSMMPGKDPKSATDALLGNLTTKIFHANGDPTTNEWAQRLFGNEVVWLSNRSVQTQGGSALGSSQAVPSPVVNVRDFATLRRGSARHNFVVDAVIFRSGVKHAEQKVTVLRTQFLQSGDAVDGKTAIPSRHRRVKSLLSPGGT